MKTDLIIPDFSKANILVVGDLMLDRYWQGTTSRISPEAPVPVVKVNQQEDRPGGAGNVALNIAALGATCRVLGLTGKDDASKTLMQKLEAADVECIFDCIPGFPTITKLRVLSRHQQLIRLDFEEGFEKHQFKTLSVKLNECITAANMIIFSDYDKGSIHLATEVISLAQRHKIPVLVDPKQTNYLPYRGATIVTPNMNEFETVVGKCRDEHDLIERAGRLIEDIQLQSLLITRGEHGMTLFQRNQPHLHLPAQAREVYDVTGAGDTVISVLGAALASGVSLINATTLANVAAGIVVGKLGTAVINVPELKNSLYIDSELGLGVVSEEQLTTVVELAKSRGETLVMTNGCFDILHAGHVAYLEQAKKLGDRLIVAVNVDDTVKNLKGEGRPVNPLDRRMAVLAALGCVDWVVPFSEETPTRLICDLLPHVLIKGGDNDPEKIPGGDCVKKAGGKVMVSNYVEKVSTTILIDSIRGKKES